VFYPDKISDFNEEMNNTSSFDLLNAIVVTYSVLIIKSIYDRVREIDFTGGMGIRHVIREYEKGVW
jgi:hypothetical protein